MNFERRGANCRICQYLRTAPLAFVGNRLVRGREAGKRDGTEFSVRYGLSAIVVSLALLPVCAASATAEPRAVVELFTSPFCSSCPKADALFVELARDPDLITLVMPVDTWNRPGRRDELARPEFTKRQAAYANVRRNQDLRMTPQAMINGTAPAIGFDELGIDKAVAQTDGSLSVPVTANVVGDELLISIGAGQPRSKSGALVMVLPYVASRGVPMRGGRSIEYANLVGELVPIGMWDGKAFEQRLRLDKYAQYDGVVVLVQAGRRTRPGAIIGAARVPTGRGESH